MDALDVIKVCVRRWWVMVPVLLFAAGAGVGLVEQQRPAYHAFGGYALVFTHGAEITASAPDPRNENPLAPVGGSLLGEALLADFHSGATQLALGRTGTKGVPPGEADDDSFFAVSLPQSSSSYLVEAWGPDPVEARAVVVRVLASAPAKAEAIQTRVGAPKISQFTTFVTQPTEVVTLPPQSAVKLLTAVGAVGVMAGAALSLVVDRLMERRRLRRRRVGPGDGPSSTGEEQAGHGGGGAHAGGRSQGRAPDPAPTA